MVARRQPSQHGGAAEIAHEHAAVVQVLPGRPGIFHREQNPVGIRRVGGHAGQGAQRLHDAAPLLDDLADARLEAGAVLEDHLSYGLGDGVHGIGLAHLAQLLDDRRVRQNVAQTHARQRERLRERAQDGEILVGRQQRAHRGARELEVGLVHQHERIGGVEQLFDERRGRPLARGVVRARHDDEIDVALPHALKHRRFVDGEVGPTRHIHAAGVREPCVGRVHREGRGQVQEAAPRAAPSEGHIEQKLVAAVAQKDIGAVEPVGLGDEIAQAVGQRIGIAVQRHLGNATRNGGAHLGVHVARILVGRQVRLGRQVLRIVGNESLKLGRRRANLIHRAPRRPPRPPRPSRPRSPARRPAAP